MTNSTDLPLTSYSNNLQTCRFRPVQADPKQNDIKPTFSTDASGIIELNGRRFKVTLYKGDKTLNPKADRKSWEQTATKIIQSLADNNLLPSLERKVDAIEVNYSTKQIREKLRKSDNLEPLSSEELKKVNIFKQADSIKNEINQYYVYNLGFVDKPSETLEKERNISSSTNNNLLLNEVHGDGNQFNFNDLGNSACTPIATLAAIKMAKTNFNPDRDKINDLVIKGIILYNEITANNKKQNDPNFLAFDEVIKNQSIKNQLKAEIDITKTIDFKIDNSQIDQNQSPNDQFKDSFNQFLTTLIQKTPNGEKLSGVLTMQAFSYAIAVQKDGNGQVLKIEFFDSHGRKNANNAYYIAFEGTKPAEDFVNFFINLDRHHLSISGEENAISFEVYKTWRANLLKNQTIYKDKTIQEIIESLDDTQMSIDYNNFINEQLQAKNNQNNISFNPIILKKQEELRDNSNRTIMNGQVQINPLDNRDKTIHSTSNLKIDQID